jgi:acyl-CoA hydrolase
LEFKEKTPKDSEVVMTELVLPHHTNDLGTVFGGMVMSWVDIAAAICATRHCHKQVVTASIDAMEFLAPVRLGWIITLRASVNYVWKTSCEVGVRVTAENPRSGENFHTASAYATMVALDGNGRPTRMLPIHPQTLDEKRRYDEAKARRTARLELKKQNAERERREQQQDAEKS